MLETLNNFVLSIADPLLSWLLLVPANLAIIIIAIGTSAILTFVRLFTTNQDLLRRCDADKKRLKQLIREAKARKDKEAVKRHRATMGGVSMKLMRAEGLPLLTFIGIILALQLAPTLEQYGSLEKIATIVGIAIFRELGPLLSAIVLSGFAGASIASAVRILTPRSSSARDASASSISRGKPRA